jgi:hypothetical protein
MSASRNSVTPGNMPSTSHRAGARQRVRHRAEALSSGFALSLLLGALCAASASAQSPTGGDEEFEFTHPLVTESPSPDTKVRLDVLDTRETSESEHISERTYQLEAEYAFQPWISVEVNVPYLVRGITGQAAQSRIGDSEAALKLASFALEPHGALVGGGVEFGLPTGNEREGIGSDHLVEVSPYVDGGYRRGPVELVGFTTFSVTTNRRMGEPADREFEYNLGGMLHFTPVVAGLMELDGASPLAGEGSKATRFNLSPGILAHPHIGNGHILFGVCAGFPITEARDFDRRLLFSGFYHF